MSKSKATLAREATERAEASDSLRKLLRPGDTVYTTLLYVSQSGMKRVIKLVAHSNTGPVDISGRASTVLDSKWDDRGGIVVGGTGMDMGFHLVYGLSRRLFADGFECNGITSGPRSCPSNDHSNERERDYTPGRIHSDPGYALHHRWL